MESLTQVLRDGLPIALESCRRRVTKACRRRVTKACRRRVPEACPGQMTRTCRRRVIDVSDVGVRHDWIQDPIMLTVQKRVDRGRVRSLGTAGVLEGSCTPESLA